MPTHVETLLTQFGLPAEDAAKIVALPEEEAKTFDPSPYTEKVKANYQTQFKNDPEFFNDISIDSLNPTVKKRLEDSQFGRAANIVKQKFYRTLGISEADVENLPAEQREKLETFIPVITEKWMKDKSSDPKLQQELIEARRKIEGYDGYEEKIKTQYETQAEQKVTAAIFRANLIGELSRIPGLKIAASDIAKTADEIISSKYAFERVGDFGVELRNKTNPTLKVLKNGSSQELTLSEALQDIATERGWIEKSQENSKGSGTVTVTPTNEGLKAVVPPHLQKVISSKIAAEK